MNLPADFLERLVTELGQARADAIVASMHEDKQVAYWVNPLRAGEVPNLGEPVGAGLPGVYVCETEKRDQLVNHEAAASGRIYLINPSSVVAVQALEPQLGEEVLDIAAAPGGKTLLTAARMANSGSILAVDAVRARFHRMQANLQRCGVANARCRHADGRHLWRTASERFDRVLLDAPCSSEARFRAGVPATWRHWAARKTREMANKQRGLLRSAFRCLKPGGTLIYCTCTFARRENEATVAYLLRKEPSARLQPLTLDEIVPASPGLLDGTRRIAPNALFDGLFLARLTKLLGHDVVDERPTRAGALA